MMFMLNIICLYMNSAPEKKNKLSEQIKQALIKDINEGVFKVGEKIPAEPELMSRFAVGRSSIREAIKSLTESHILTVRQGYGTIVNRIEEQPIEHRLRNSDFAEINYVRTMLEKEIVSLAALNRREQDIIDMEQSLEKRRLAISQEIYEACIDADIEFHMTIARASGNKVLADLYLSFTTIIRDFFSRREPGGITKFALSHHLHEKLAGDIKAKSLSNALSTIATILDNNH